MARIFIVTCAFLVLFAGCVGLATVLFGPAVERELVSRTKVALGEIKGFPSPGLVVEAEGRDLMVKATVRRKALLESAGRKLAEVEGIGVLDNQIEFLPLDPWLVVMRDKEGKLFVNGLLASRAEKARLSLAVKEKEDAPEIIVNAGADSDVAEAPWIEPLGRVLPELMKVGRMDSITVKDGAIEVAGEIYAESSGDNVEKVIAEALPDMGLEIKNRLLVVPPPLAPWILLEKLSAEKLIAKGTLRSESHKHELIGIAASELSQGAKITNLVEFGDNVAAVPWWKEAVTVLPALLAEMDTCAIDVREGKITIKGNVSSKQMRESVTALVEQNFVADAWERDLALTVVEPPVPSRLSVIVFSGDQIFLKGVLPSEEVKGELLELAGENIPGKEIVDQIELRANAIAPKWIGKFSEFLPGYSENALRGGATIDDEQLVIEARVDSDAKWDALFALAEKHFPMSEYRHRIDLRVIDPSAPDPDDPLGPVDPDAVAVGGEGG